MKSFIQKIANFLEMQPPMIRSNLRESGNRYVKMVYGAGYQAGVKIMTRYFFGPSLIINLILILWLML